MTAYKLKTLLSDNVDITIIEKGNTLYKRHCPAKKGLPCTHCDTCSIVSGIAGAGAFSDGKFNLGTAYGGTLGDELGEETTMRYIKELDDLICSLMPTLTYPTQVYGSNEEISKKCLANNLRLLDMDVRHLGTDLNLTIMINLVDKLTNFGVKIITNTEVTRITKISSGEKRFFNLTLTGKNSSSSMSADKVVLAVGRNGTPFLTNYCQENGIHMKSNAVDIGVRVEMKDAVWDDISSKIYEPKITFRTPTFEDRTRMFCFNKGGSCWERLKID
jgi:uncharacterized FAD-dependent dehydrogenase